ncbi:MAG TPA: GTP cyclohydrolase MptA [Candidatus Dormibacteraeota bacterium]|nr:GTP cyclohydrolase MptA [Candidatus Dormibacteraeota bacterium]
MDTVYLGLGSNLGDRQANIMQALQKLRAYARILRVSGYYQTQPYGAVAGPDFLNAAVAVETDLDPLAFERALRRVEEAVGRQRGDLGVGVKAPTSARCIDVDVLLWGDRVADFGRFAVPHPYLAERPYNLIPLAEIAGEVREPRSGLTVGELAATVDRAGIVRQARALHFKTDRQNQEPEVRLSLDRVGVSSVRRVLRLRVGEREQVFNGEFAMVADLRPEQSGVHMSRFSELLEEALLDVLARSEGAPRVEDLTAQVAREIVTSQRALRAEVRLRADFGLERWTPVSGKRGEETYALIALAVADAREGLGGEPMVRRAVGVEAEGMTACPCAQLMVREHSLNALMDAGFDEQAANRALDALPVATHNQRGRGTVLIGFADAVRESVALESLVEIVENSMSSETYGLLKRPDEFFVVNKAHQNPKFVEDVVRGILARALDMYADFPDETFIAATQVNYESIHKHDAFAEACGTFGELRRELHGGERLARKTDLAAWLRADRAGRTAARES